jgi:hypothetical protein
MSDNMYYVNLYDFTEIFVMFTVSYNFSIHFSDH